MRHIRHFLTTTQDWRRQARTRKGFTIVEVLIVIVAISILATITVVSYNGVQHRAREAALQADTRTLISEIEAHYAQRGTFPVNLATLNNGRGVKVGKDFTFVYAPIAVTASTASGYCVAVYTTVYPKSSVFAASHKNGETKGYAPANGTQVCTAQENGTTVNLTITGVNPTAVTAS